MNDGPKSDTRATVGIVHDFLVERGGAERVAVQFLKAFPDATIYTALYSPEDTYPEFRSAQVAQLLPNWTKSLPGTHRMLLPAAALALDSLTIDADIIIASTSGLSHRASTTGSKLVYCHTPGRWLHDPDHYHQDDRIHRRAMSSLIRKIWLRSDVAAMRSAGRVLANSDHTREEIQAQYGIDSLVVRPASSFDPYGPTRSIEDCEPGFLLTPSRLLRYKRLDILLEAASLLPEERFLIVGEGPNLSETRRHAPSNVMVTGGVTEPELRWAYENCSATVLTCAEDFGLVPSESERVGKWSIIPIARGLREQLGHGRIGYRYLDVDDLVEAIRALKNQVEVFSAVDADHEGALFRKTITDLVDELGADR